MAPNSKLSNAVTPEPKAGSEHAGHRERLRQRFLDDPTLLPDYELLELLLGYVLLRKNTKPLAKGLLKHFKYLKNVFDAPPAELAEVEGIGPGVQTFFAVMRECRVRYAEIPPHTKVVLDNPEKVVNMARHRLSGLRHEEVWAVFLDTQNKLIAWKKLSTGAGGHAYISSPEVLRIAVEYQATGMVLVHNHPGGNVMPSPADIDLTKRLSTAASHLAIRLLDHIVVTDNDYFSMSEHNVLE